MVKTKSLQVLIAFFNIIEITTLGAISPKEKNIKTAYDFYLSGNRFYREARYEEAIRAFEKSIQLDPDYYYTRVNLGVVLIKNQQFKQAVQQFTFCIEKKFGSEADRFVFYFNRILADQEIGPTQFSRKDWAVLKKLDPARTESLRQSTDYIFMDPLYAQRRNAADKDRLFQKNKASIAKGKVIVRKIAGHRKNAEEYEAIGFIEGTLQAVYGVLTDYKSFPEFMPNVKEINIRNSSDDEFVVDHKLSLPLGVVKKYRLRYWAKTEPNRIQLFWKKLPRPELKPSQTVVDTYGQWILENAPDRKNQVLAYYRVYTDPGRIPLGTGWIVDILTKESIPNVIKGTRRRVKQVTAMN